MKCMAVPANLTWAQWFALAVRQLKQLGYAGSAWANQDEWRKLFNGQMSVNEAVSYWIGTQVAEED